MLTRVILLGMTSLLFQQAAAEAICLDLENIKKGDFKEFLPLNKLDDEPASPTEIQKFKKTVRNFAAAYWSPDYEFGKGRCDYSSAIEVYLAKQIDCQPTGTHWNWDGIISQCISKNITDCEFSCNNFIE